MLSETPSNHSPGQHRRQNSTPTTAMDSSGKDSLRTKEDTKGHHRRGLSLDQTIKPSNMKQGNARGSIESVFTPQLSEELMQETQPKPQMARPGQQRSNTNIETQQYRNYTPLAPRPEPGFTNEQLSAIMTYWNNDPGQFLDSIIKIQHAMNQHKPAGCLEGFGNDLDNTSVNYLAHDASGYKEVQPQALQSEDLSSGPLYGVNLQRPQTPPNQIGQSK